MKASTIFDGPFLVRRDQIPATAEKDLAVRPFAAHELLVNATAGGVELSWIHARDGADETGFRLHSRPSLLIILRGSAELVGPNGRVVEPGDVVTLPRDHAYRFTSVEPGFHALQVTFPAEEEESSEEDSLTLERLLARNELRVRLALETPFFRSLRDGTVDTPRKRAAAREAIRVFSDAFQTLLFTRQATCTEPEYAAMFHSHLVEELGHNKMLDVSGTSRISKDPLLRATASWFCHQMLIQDNAGKSVVNLALETGGYYFHTLAKPVFSTDDSSRYFDVHAEDDEHHKEMGIDLLRGQHPNTYARLLKVLDDSWDMIEVMTRRFAELIEIESTDS